MEAILKPLRRCAELHPLTRKPPVSMCKTQRRTASYKKAGFEYGIYGVGAKNGPYGANGTYAEHGKPSSKRRQKH